MHQALKNFIFEELVQIDDTASFTENDDLLEAGLDSMGIMRLVLFIEEELGVSLPDEEIEPDNIQTLKSIVSWIERHRS
ncbi:MAG: phosphopantetheine-binding protein [Proteobacteria bacterium]|nr:MAG: phosphopantetheine-binding protein [Pseudomonadota bacterium]